MITASLRVSRNPYNSGTGARHIKPSALQRCVSMTNEFTISRHTSTELSEARLAGETVSVDDLDLRNERP